MEDGETQDKFLNYLKSDAKILDFGCGAGRDTKYFLEHEYDVDASDGSIEMVKAASKLTGLDVKLLLFEDLNEKDMYDGISKDGRCIKREWNCIYFFQIWE